MLKYFIQAVQDLFGGFSLLVLVFGLITASGRFEHKRKKVFAFACGAGLGAAFIFAVLKQNTALVNRELVNITVLSAAILCAILSFLFILGFLKEKAPKFYESGAAFSFAVFSASVLFYCLSGIFLAPSGFVISDESFISTDVLFKSAGLLFGASLVCIAVLSLRRVCASLSYKQIRVFVCAGLFFTSLNYGSEILQLLTARRIISLPRALFHCLLPVFNYKIIFIYLFLAVVCIMAIIAYKNSFRMPKNYANPAQFRKTLANAKSQRRASALIFACVLCAILTMTALKVYDGREVQLSLPEPREIDGENIVISVDKVNDGHLHRFSYVTKDGIEVRFIVIKKNEISYGVGLDACDICGETGYYERSDGVICKLCDVVMNISTIGFKGGCNPVPLAYTHGGRSLLIKIQDLENEKGRFK